MYSKSNENTQHYYDYLKCNLNLINEINDRKKNLEKMSVEQQNKLQGQLDEQQNKVKDLESKIELLQNRFNDSEKANSKLQIQLDDSKEKNDVQQNKVKDLESKIELLQNQVNDSNNVNSEQKDKVKDLESKMELLQKANNKLQIQLDDSKEKNDEQLNKMKDLENLITQLQNKLEDSVKEPKKQSLFEGQIVASVEKGILINAEINLKTECGTLDTSKSKVIVSTSDVKCLGCEAYEKGEPITSLHMKTTFARASGTFYVRCIAFNSDGESNEIVSNPVTATLSSFTFEFDEQKRAPAIISLPRGQYKLEVWGAKGGDSTGDGISSGEKRGNGQTAKGCLGGYSRGILSLTKNETVYVYVGEQGKPSNSSDGLSTDGGFPDGGGKIKKLKSYYMLKSKFSHFPENTFYFIILYV